MNWLERAKANGAQQERVVVGFSMNESARMAESQQTPNGATIHNLQMLRFVAAALVVYAHLGLGMYGLEQPITNQGEFGVDIFFVISGFIMPYVAFGVRTGPVLIAKMPASRFFLRRLIRIWPLYAAATLAVVLIAYLIDATFVPPINTDLLYHFGMQKTEGLWIWESLTFSHTDRPPILAIGWTLQLEFFFYCLFAVALALKPRNADQLWIGAILGYCSVWLASHSLPLLSAPAYLVEFTNLAAQPVMLEFALGLVIYRIYISGFRTGFAASCLIALAAVGFYLLHRNSVLYELLPFEQFRPFVWGLPAAGIVWAALCLEGKIRTSRWVECLGNASYSLYLVHWLIVPAVAAKWASQSLHQVVPAPIYAAALFAVCIGVALLVHEAEKPLQHFLRARSRNQKFSAPLSPNS